MRLALAMPRMRNVLIPLLFALTTLIVFSQAAYAENIPPAGIGDLLPSPGGSIPPGHGTFYETYSNPLLFQLDTDYGMSDIFDPVVEIIASVCMALISAIGSACVVITEWVFKVASLPALEHAISNAISGASKDLTETLLPAALVVGALTAYAKNRQASGSGISQLAWLMASGVLAVSLLVSPQTWVNGIDTTRSVGSSVAMNAASAGIGNGTKEPIDLGPGHTVDYGKDTQEAMLRKSSDAVWRSMVVTPWCVAEFGSLKVCKKYGKDLLDQGTDPEARKKWLVKHVSGPAVGDASVSWRQGHTPLGRVMVTLAALVVVILFAALVLMLAFASLASLLGALMLLVSGVVFACLWVIPGRPRQWGLRWFDFLLGWTLQSFVSTMVLGVVLVVNTAATNMIGVYGWFAGAGISVSAAVVAFRFRKVMEAILGVTGSITPGAAIGALLAARGAGRLAGALGRGLVSGIGGMRLPRLPRGSGGGPKSAPQPGGSGGGSAGPAPTGIPRRPLPPLPSSQNHAPLPSRRQPAEVKSAPSRPELPASSAPARGRSVESGPATTQPPLPQRRTVQVGTARQRPAVPAGTGTGSGGSEQRPVVTGKVIRPEASTAPEGRPSPTLRPESGTAPNYTFRQGPRPGASAPRVIRGQVIRSETHRPGGPAGPQPTRPTSGGRSRGRRMSVPGMRRGK